MKSINVEDAFVLFLSKKCIIIRTKTFPNGVLLFSLALHVKLYLSNGNFKEKYN